MARPLRVEYAGACYHVINRGNYRQRIFAGKGAAESFERALGEAATRFGWRVHGIGRIGRFGGQRQWTKLIEFWASLMREAEKR